MKRTFAQHVFTPDLNKVRFEGVLPRPCVHCEATKDSPREFSTYHHRYSPNKHPFTYIIQEQP